MIFSGVAKRHDEIAPWRCRTNIFASNINVKVVVLNRVNEAAQANSQAGASRSASIPASTPGRALTFRRVSSQTNSGSITPTRCVCTLAASIRALRYGIECCISSRITGRLSPYVDAFTPLVVASVDDLSARGIHCSTSTSAVVARSTTAGQNPLLVPMDEFAHAVRAEIAGHHLDLLIEPGRSIVGDAGLLLTRVEFLKPGRDKNFALVDAAMNVSSGRRFTTHFIRSRRCSNGPVKRCSMT